MTVERHHYKTFVKGHERKGTVLPTQLSCITYLGFYSTRVVIQSGILQILFQSRRIGFDLIVPGNSICNQKLNPKPKEKKRKKKPEPKPAKKSSLSRAR